MNSSCSGIYIVYAMCVPIPHMVVWIWNFGLLTHFMNSYMLLLRYRTVHKIFQWRLERLWVTQMTIWTLLRFCFRIQEVQKSLSPSRGIDSIALISLGLRSFRMDYTDFAWIAHGFCAAFAWIAHEMYHDSAQWLPFGLFLVNMFL